MVYNKQRSKTDISAVTSALEALNEKFSVITYGSYRESEYRSLLGRSKALIWVGRSESQGIGLLEALAMNVPALVWEIKKFGQWTGDGHEFFSPSQLVFSSALTAPYFDSRCGLKFTDHSELGSKLDEFLAGLNEFKPRSYILGNLSLETQAEAFMNIYREHLGQNQLSLKDSTLTTEKKWQNGQLYFQLKTRLKDAIRQIIR